MAAENDAFSEGILNNQGRHIPAWKRIGLKLKHAKDATENPSGSLGVNSTASITRDHEKPFEDSHRIKRRKIDHSVNRPRPESHSSNAVQNPKVNGVAKTKRHVTFTEDDLKVSTSQSTQASAIDPKNAAESSYTVDRPQQEKKIQHSQPSNQKGDASLAYLDQHNTSRDSWKFNKNKEIWLLQNALTIEHIPSSYNLAFSNYLKGLKGDRAKAKLRASAEAAINQDKATKIEASSSENNADKRDVEAEATGKAVSFPMDDPVACREAYEAEIRRYKHRIDECLKAEDEELDMEDPKLQKRLAKRKRAELILWSLGPCETASDSATRFSPYDRSRDDPSALSSAAVPSNTRKVKQLRKVRTAEMNDISSSSEDEDSYVSREKIDTRSADDGADSTSPSQTDSSSHSDTDSSTLQEVETSLESESESDSDADSGLELSSETTRSGEDAEESSSSSSDETEDGLV